MEVKLRKMLRKVFRVTITEIEFKDIKTGDLFILRDDAINPVEDGTTINRSYADAAIDCVKCDEIGEVHAEDLVEGS